MVKGLSRRFPQKTVFLHHGVCAILHGCQTHHTLPRILMGNNVGFFSDLDKYGAYHSLSASCVPDNVLSALDTVSVKAQSGVRDESSRFSGRGL